MKQKSEQISEINKSSMKDEQNDEVQEQQGQMKVGRWSDEEHLKFLKGVVQHGKNWLRIQEIVKSRNCCQVRSHSQKYFHKLVKVKKERQKQKSKLTAKLTIQQDQILQHFTHDHITERTPVQILYFIQKNSNQGVTRRHQNSNKLKQSPSKVNKKLENTHVEKTLNLAEQTKNFLQIFQQYQEKPDQSFLITVLRNNCINQPNFNNLFDLGTPHHLSNLQSIKNDEHQLLQQDNFQASTTQTTGKRKKSWTLFEPENNLEEALNKIRNSMK